MSTEKDQKPGAVPAAEKPPVIERTPTPEELAAEEQAFTEAFTGGARKKAPEKKPEPEKKSEPPKEEKKPEEEQEQEAPKPRAKGPTKAELAERVKMLEERQQMPPEPEQKKETEKPNKEAELEASTEDLTDEELDHLEAVKVLERDDKRFAGASKRQSEFYAKAQAYRKKWMAQNRGKVFDPADEEHNEFYADEPQFDDSVIRAAKKKARIEQIQKASDEAVERYAKKNVEPKLKAISSAKALEAATPEIIASGQRRVAELAAEISDDFKKLVDTPNGPIITQESAEKMKESDPELYEILAEHAEPVDIMTQELKRIEKTGVLLDPNFVMQLHTGEEFRPHQLITDAWMRLERRLLGQKKDDQKDENGRQFLSSEDYNKRWQTARSNGRLPELESSFWTITPDGLSGYIRWEQAQKIKRIIARTNSRVERLTKKSTAKPESDGKPKDEKKADEKPVHRSPATASASDMQDNSLANGKADEESEETFRKVFAG